MEKTKIAILGIVALFAVLAALPAASAVATLHFVPQDISVPEGYCNTRNVEIRINLSADETQFSYGQFGFSYDPLCGNITSRTLNTDIMTGIDPSWSSWNWYTMDGTCWNETRDWIVFSFWIPKDGPADLLVGNHTIHCNSTEYCTNDLNFGCMPDCPQCPPCIGMWDTNDDPVNYSTINGTFTGGTPEPEFDNVTTRDIPVSGTVSGNHTLTQESDNVYESIEELAITTGKPSGRISYLEHIWTIDVISGTKTNVTFHLKANHTANDENEHFVFAYSTDNISYSDMVTVYNTDDNNEYQIYKLPNETSGIVYIRVMDTDRIVGNNDPDTIYIDHMYIHSVLGPPDETPPVITNVTNTAPTHNSATIEWDTDEPADSIVKYGTASGSYTMNESDATSVTSHNIELTGLESNATYYYVVNSTDPSGNSNESAEYSFTTESQSSMPDFEIADIWCQYVRKNTYDLYYNITNNGGVEAGRSDSNWTVDGVEEGTDKVASLAPGQTSTEKFTYRGSAPNTVKMCADYNSKIDESDETNNCMEKTVTCT